jgi:hypothetical protein
MTDTNVGAIAFGLVHPLARVNILTRIFPKKAYHYSHKNCKDNLAILDKILLIPQKDAKSQTLRVRRNKEGRTLLPDSYKHRGFGQDGAV